MDKAISYGNTLALFASAVIESFLWFGINNLVDT